MLTANRFAAFVLPFAVLLGQMDERSLRYYARCKGPKWSPTNRLAKAELQRRKTL